MKKFNLKTREGCLRLLALFLCGIFMFSFCASLVASDFGKVKISHLKYDVRGAELDYDLYIPAGTSSNDKMPCVIVSHGRGITKNSMRSFSVELARRGFVVINMNAYGMGLSELPVSDETENGVEKFMFGTSPHGLLDMVDYARTLTYVDSTRIALLGHSFGSRRSTLVATMDAGYFTLNDRLINILADTFGQTFTEEEIAQNADELAKKRLNADQLTYYKVLRDAEEETFNTRVHTLVLTGQRVGPDPRTVVVGGHEVTRECQVNVTFVVGKYDSLAPGAMWNADGTCTFFGDPPKKIETWYSVATDGSEYTEIGNVETTSALTNEALRTALQNRSARLVCYNVESHAKNISSNATTKDAVRIIQEAFAYNNGELTAGATPLDPGNMIWGWQTAFNFLAMLCMFGMLFPLACLLMSTKFFAPCIREKHESSGIMSKGMYWGFAIFTIVTTIFGMYQTNKSPLAAPVGPGLPTSIFKVTRTSTISFVFVVWLAGFALLGMILKVFMVKKRTGELHLKSLNITGSIATIGKTVLISIICIAFANGVLTAIMRLFNQDFRLWQVAFGEMKIEQWLVALPYAIAFFAMFLVIGAAINYGADSVAAGWKETLLTVVVNSGGVSLLCLFCFIMWFIRWTGTAISDFTASYSVLLVAPLTVFIARKMYKLTNSIWLGAFLNAELVAWSLVSGAGNADSYLAQGIISVLFGV